MPLIQHPVDALDQHTVTGLTKDDHIASPDFTRRKGNPRNQDIITIMKFGMKAEAADFQQTQNQF